MATRSSSLAQRQRTSRQAPAPPDRRQAPPLGVLDKRHVIARAHRRQARVLLTLAAVCLAGPLLLAALGHALVAAQQVRSDALQSQIAQALQTQQDYQLQRAELVAPGRILSIAETRLHMVTPASVTYLPPVSTGESVARAHAAGWRSLAPRNLPGSARPRRGTRSTSTTSTQSTP